MTYRRIVKAWEEHGTYGNNDGYYDRWDNAKAGVPWNTPGGDVADVIASNSGASTGLPYWAKTNLSTTVVKQWISNPATNFGFMILAESDENDGVTYYTSYYQNKTLTPKLVLTYTADVTQATPTDNRTASRKDGWTVTHRQIKFSGTGAAEGVSFHTCDGRLLNARPCGDGGSWDLSSLSRGLYVVQWRSAGHTARQTIRLD